MKEDELHEMYSSSSTIHLIKQRYRMSFLRLSIQLKMSLSDMLEIKSGREQLGLDNYNKIVELFPELENKICYKGDYNASSEL